jgi:putative transposase
MSWKTKLVSAHEVTLHAYNRGVDRCPLFYRKSDYEYFLEEMERRLSLPGVILLFYILMPNHYHFVAIQQEPYAISKYVQLVTGNYALYLNKTRLRTGHLFQAPFKPKKVADPASILRLSYYVHFNAVQAGLVPSPEKWPFSSIFQYIEGGPSGLVVTKPLLDLVGGIEGYRNFLQTYDRSQPATAWDFIKR